MKKEKQENLMNRKINPETEELADLHVTDEQAQQAKGGPTQGIALANILTHEL